MLMGLRRQIPLLMHHTSFLAVHGPHVLSSLQDVANLSCSRAWRPPNIFKTWDFAQFQNKLKDETIAIKAFYDELKTSIIQYLSDIQTDDAELKDLKENAQ